MTRPLRLELPDAIYHVTSRGNRQDAIFVDDEDRQRFLSILAQTLDRFQASVVAYCLMDNHYHLVLYTPLPNLSALMRRLNGMVTQSYNRSHGKVGHLFQGRFKAILVDQDAYLLTLCRYVERNPVRAGMVPHAKDWPWSSYRAHIGNASSPPWLASIRLHGYLLGRTPETPADTKRAQQLYRQMVQDEDQMPIWKQGLRQQIFLGDEAFARRMQAMIDEQHLNDGDIPKQQRLADKPLATWLEQANSREHGLYLAHKHGGKTMTALAQELGLSVSRVSRLVARGRNDGA
jgi:putative transposase